MAAASIVASAGSLFSARRYSEAERMLSAAIARCVDDEILEQLLYHRGRCLRKLALHAACAEDFSRVVQHGGKLASVARAYRGTALAELGLITLAVQDYTVALECVGLHCASFLWHHASAFAAGTFMFSHSHFRPQSVPPSPSPPSERADDYPTRLNRGEALLNIGRAREALQDVEVYVGAFPDNVDGRVLQGQVRRRVWSSACCASSLAACADCIPVLIRARAPPPPLPCVRIPLPRTGEHCARTNQRGDGGAGTCAPAGTGPPRGDGAVRQSTAGVQ